MLNSSDDILNWDTYPNHLSPAEGFAFQIRGDITVVIVGAALCDVFTYLVTDTRIVRGSRFSFVIFCFIFSRLFALGHICFVAVNKAPTEYLSPHAFYVYSACLCMLSMMTSSFLFLQRVLLIYHESKWVRRGFSFLWLVASLSDILIPLGGPYSSKIPETNDPGVAPWVSLSVWLTLSFDTAVVLAISYRMWMTHRMMPENQNLSRCYLLSGASLPRLSRLVFRGELQYYLIIVGSAMMTAFTLSLSSVPQVYKNLFLTILIFLMSSMASRVFRNIKLFTSDVILTEAAPVDISMER